MQLKSLHSTYIYSLLGLIIFALFQTQCNCEEFYYSDDCDSINGQFGQCVPLRSCPLFLSFLTKRPIRKINLKTLVEFTCKFDIEEPKVCCPVQNIVENGVKDTQKQYNNDKNSESVLDRSDQNYPKIKIEATAPYIYIQNRIVRGSNNNGYMYQPPIEHTFTFSDRISSRNQGAVIINSRNLDLSAEKLYLQRNSQEDDSSPAIPNKNLKSHQNFQLIPDLQQCSNSFKLDRLLGTFGTYPWLALIGNKDPQTKKFQHFCTGSVINKRYILTSAYCVQEGNPQVVRVGEYNLDTELDFGSQFLPPLKATEYEVETSIAHSEYSKNTQENDIALIRLTKDIDFDTPYVKPVCLPFAKEYDIEKRLQENDITKLSGKLGWIVGWGRNNFGLILKDRILEENTVPIISNEECSMKHRSSTKFTNSNTQFCAGGRRKRTPCVSDRGGPFLFPAKIPSGQTGLNGPKFFQIGINVQNSKNCEEDGFTLPTIYTKISSFLEWILNNIER